MPRVLILGLILLVGLATPPTHAADLETKGEALGQLGKAMAVTKRVRAEANFKPEIEPMLARARGVMIIPEFFKGSFIVGGAYGTGLLMVRQPDGSFSPPAFYKVMEGSVGLQIGGQRAEIIMLLMTDKAIRAIMNDQFKASAGVGITVGVLGGNVGTGSTTEIDQDIYFFSLATGLFAGGALEGAVIQPRTDYNHALYGQPVSPDAILFEGRASQPDAAELQTALGTNQLTPAANPDTETRQGAPGPGPVSEQDLSAPTGN